MNLLLTKNIDSIKELCLKYQVTELYAFGSVVRDDFDSKSDVDFLLEYDYASMKLDPLENFLSLKTDLELLLERSVDLVEYSQLTNRYLKYFIDKEKLQLYA